MSRSRCPVIPPWLLSSVARRGGPEQRDWALHTLAVDASLRTSRLISASQPPPAEPAPDLSQPTPRAVYDAGGTEDLPGKIARASDGPDQPAGDVAVDEAWNGMGATDTYLRDVHRRASLDGEGTTMEAVVHFGERYANAFWDGRRIVCGDGDGELFVRFTASLDVLAHELGHGVVDDTTGLVYRDQPGALSEHCADVIGTLVTQHAANQTVEKADWLIGDEVLGPTVDGVALRSMAAPGTAYDDDVLGRDPQPAHMDDFVVTVEDNGGVHINSGIPNHAFYAVATGLGGHAWERAGAIWYGAMVDDALTPESDFAAFAAVTAGVAGRVFGQGSVEAKAVRAGWRKVGLDPG
ncbi:MAG: M4 family metallopeptidase [Acidimicrobiia bacterium]